MYAGFAAALYLALIVAAYGLVSLATDAEVIGAADAGLFVGPAIIAAAVAALLVHLAVVLRRPSGLLGPVLLAAVWTWLAAFLAATVAYAIATGKLLGAVLFALAQGVGVFGLLVPVLAALVAWFAVFAAGADASGASRPRWPWERDEE